jgi:hypothetical protein
MSVGKRTYQTVQSAVRKRAARVPFNTVWASIWSETGCGERSGNELLLRDADRDRLREWLKQETGADPLMVDLDGDRHDLAARANDEKWSSHAVFEGMLRVNAGEGVVRLRQGEARTPPGTLLFVAAEDLVVEAGDTVVVVENGATARAWHRCLTPEPLRRALMVYRGHDQEGRVVRDWYAGLPPGVTRVGYFDLDPAGLGLAMKLGAEAILVPSELDPCLLTAPGNKPETHLAQMEARPGLRDQLPSGWRALFDWMRANRCAVTQERLTVTGRALRLLPANKADMPN